MNENIITSNNNIPNNNKNVNDIKITNKVVHSNELIKSVSKLDRTPLKIFEIALSCIDINNPPTDNTVYLDKQQLFNCFHAEDTNKYTRFKEHMINLQKQNLYLEDGKRRQNIMPIPFSEWSIDENNNLIKIEFSKQIMPYIIDLKQNFTQYQLKETISLNSKHSIVLFKWLMMNYNQRNYNYNKRHPIISINDLRLLTNTINEYKLRFSHFEDRIIKQSVNEINEKTSLYVTYKKIKKSRKIDSIQFFIKEKNKQDSSIAEGQTTLDEFIEDITLEDLLKEINSLFSSDEQYQATLQDELTLKFFVSQYGATNTRKAFVKCHVLEKYDTSKKVDLKSVEDYLQHDKVEID